MSGQLVGEVLDAAEVLRARGLSERGFHALVAIAEKCHHVTRQGSVPWKHISAGLYGASLPTAKRAVADLKRAGVLRTVKRGFNNQCGRICAPIYEIQLLTERITHVIQSPQTERITQVTQSPTERTDQTGGRTDQISDRTDHPGDPLNGSIDGSKDGGAAQAPTQPLPSPFCSKHPHGTLDGCHACGDARVARKAWEAQKAAAEKADKDRIRAAIDACTDCDFVGRLDDLRDCPKHPNFRKAPAA
jgi:hypothetical protein